MQIFDDQYGDANNSKENSETVSDVQIQSSNTESSNLSTPNPSPPPPPPPPQPPIASPQLPTALNANELPNLLPVPSPVWPPFHRITATIFRYLPPDALLEARNVCQAFERYSQVAAARVRHMTLLSDQQAAELVYGKGDELGPFFYTNTVDGSFSSFRVAGDVDRAIVARSAFALRIRLADNLGYPMAIGQYFCNVTSLTFVQRTLSADFFFPLMKLLKAWSRQLTSLRLIIFTEGVAAFGLPPRERQAWDPNEKGFKATIDLDIEDFTFAGHFRALINSLNNLPKLRRLTLKYAKIPVNTFDQADLAFVRHLEEFHLVGVPLYSMPSAFLAYFANGRAVEEEVTSEECGSSRRRMSFRLSHHQPREYSSQCGFRHTSLYTAHQHLLRQGGLLFAPLPSDRCDRPHQVDPVFDQKGPLDCSNALTRAHIGSNLPHQDFFDHFLSGFQGGTPAALRATFEAFFSRQPNLELLDLHYLPWLPSFNLLTQMTKPATSLRFIDGLVVMGEQWPQLSPSTAVLAVKKKLKGLRVLLKEFFHHDYLLRVFTELSVAFPKLNCLRIVDCRNTDNKAGHCLQCPAREKKKEASKKNRKKKVKKEEGGEGGGGGAGGFADEDQLRRFADDFEEKHDHQVKIETKFEQYAKRPARVDCFLALVPELKTLFPSTIIVYE